jgi:hypothetical protein
MPPDGSHHFTECHLTKVVFASTGFHSWEARSTLILQNIENKCCPWDYWLHWSKGLRLCMEFAQDATWWISPLHRMSPNKGVFYCSLCQHWIWLMGGKKDCVSKKYWKFLLTLWLLIEFMDRVKVIHGVCTWCHLMVFTTSQNKPNKVVFYCSVCQHWIWLMGGKKDRVSTKYWKFLLSLWSLIAFMDRVKVIHGDCTGCHLMVFCFTSWGLPTLDFTHGRQEGPCFYEILKINVIIVIIDCIDW